jgi:UMF1 family MFS transporter
MVQGGAQALSRSLYATMIPKAKSSEFFGFFSVFLKFAGIIGPFIFAVVSQVTGTGRLGILSLIVFFVGGIILLALVDVEEGRRVARLENATLQPAPRPAGEAVDG